MSDLEPLSYSGPGRSSGATVATFVGFGCASFLLFLLGVGVGVGVGWGTRNVKVMEAEEEITSLYARIGSAREDLEREAANNERLKGLLQDQQQELGALVAQLRSQKTLTAEAEAELQAAAELFVLMEQDLDASLARQREKADRLAALTRDMVDKLDEEQREKMELATRLRKEQDAKWHAFVGELEGKLCNRRRRSRKGMCEQRVRQAAYSQPLRWVGEEPMDPTVSLGDEFDYCLDSGAATVSPEPSIPCTRTHDRTFTIDVPEERLDDWCISLCTTDVPEGGVDG